VFIVLVEGPQRGVDAKVTQQLSCGSGVFSQHEMGFFETVDCPLRHVA
jgi:hypothetical protein